MVVRLGRLEPPLVDNPAAALGKGPRLGAGNVLGKEPVLFGLAAVKRQATPVTRDGGQSGMHEGLPIVRVVRDVPVFVGYSG